MIEPWTGLESGSWDVAKTFTTGMLSVADAFLSCIMMPAIGVRCRYWKGALYELPETRDRNQSDRELA